MVVSGCEWIKNCMSFIQQHRAELVAYWDTPHLALLSFPCPHDAVCFLKCVYFAGTYL